MSTHFRLKTKRQDEFNYKIKNKQIIHFSEEKRIDFGFWHVF